MTQFKGFSGISEAQLRLLFSFLFRQDSTGLATDGVLTGLGVTQTATASASVLVAAGAGVVQDSVLNGAQPLVLDSQLTLDVLTANPVGGLPRNDMVVFDAATLSAGTGGVRVITGTPNASPTDPAVPATAVRLARLRHAASATTVPSSVIDDLRVTTALAPDPGKLGVTSTLAGKRVHRQTYTTGITDASGFLTVNHSAGFTPSSVQVIGKAPGSSFAVPWGSDLYTSTQARLRFMDPRSTAPSSGAFASAATGDFDVIFWE